MKALICGKSSSRSTNDVRPFKHSLCSAPFQAFHVVPKTIFMEAKIKMSVAAAIAKISSVFAFTCEFFP
jgi:hypothetical protein